VHTVGVRRRRIRTAAAIVAALAVAVTSGCSGDEPKSAKHGRSSAVTTCAGAECKVRVRCKGEVHVRLGPAPVRVSTRKSALVTTIYADFAGSRHDATVRC
jgi:hypothetical protein